MGMFQEMVFISFFSGIFVFLGWAVQRVLGKWYQPTWRYYLWLILGLRLLIPVDLSMEQAPIRLEMTEVNENGTPPEKAHLGEGDFSGLEGRLEEGMQQTEALWHIGALVWISGLVVLGLYFVIRYQIQWRRMRRFSLPEMNRDLCGQWTDMLKQQGIRRKIPVYRSEYIYAPVLIGVRKKYLLLPEKHFEGEELEYIFRHESKHLVYHHMLIKLLGLFLCCVYWYQPMIWLMKRELDKDIEAFCDGKAVWGMDDGERYLYTQTMLRCMTFAEKSPVLVSSGFGGTMGVMKERIRWIMKGKGLKKGIGIFAAFALVLGVGSVTIAYGQGGNENMAQPEKNQQEEIEVPETYAEEVEDDAEVTENEAPEAYAEEVEDDAEVTENEVPEAYAEEVTDDAEVTENEVPEAYAEEVEDDAEVTENKVPEAYAEEVTDDAAEGNIQIAP